MLKGTFYVLEDVLKARYPDATPDKIQDMVKEHHEQKIQRMAKPSRHQWIDLEEAAVILNVPSAILPQKLKEFAKILSVDRDGRRYYDLRDCFRAAFQEVADEEQLDQIIIDYKKDRLQKGIEDREKNEKNPVRE